MSATSDAPTLSIVLPCFNSGAHLSHALDAALGQSLADIEVIVVDDASTDDTSALALHRAEADPRVRVIRLAQNGGVARARQRGVEEARGEYVWFVDADDDWPADAAEHLVGRALATGADVVVAGAEFVYTDGSRRALVPPDFETVSGRSALALLLRGRLTGHLWNKLFRRATIARAAFAPARVQSDLALTADGLSQAGVVSISPLHVYDYRLRTGSIITTPTSRRESLAIIGPAVAESARRQGLEDSAEWRYFHLRYIVLSGMKDAVLAPYDSSERTALVRDHRRRIRLADLVFLARARDPQRLALAASAKVSVPLYRALLAVAER